MSAVSDRFIEPATAGSIKYARQRMDADTKALVTKLVGQDGLDTFLASDRVDGTVFKYIADAHDHNRYIVAEFKHIFADMIIAAAPQADQRTLSVTAPVQPDVYISPAAAAAAAVIDKKCPYHRDGTELAEDNVFKDDGAMELYLFELWTVFLHAVKIVPYDNPLQYQLMGFLRSLGSKSRGTVRVWGKESNLWPDFPLLGGVEREQWIPADLKAHDVVRCVEQGHRDRLDDERRRFTEYEQHWISFSTFQARRIATDPEAGFGWLLYGFIDTAQAAEKPPPPQPDGPDDVIGATHQRAFACAVRVACHWILLTGEKLYRWTIRDVDDNLENGTARFCDEASLRIMRKNMYELYVKSGGTETGKHGQRWLFWQKRFEALGSSDESDPNSGKRLGLDDDLRTVACLAAERMVGYQAQVDAELAEKVEEA